MAEFQFARRRICDQEITVEAPTLKEAWARARRGECDEAGDDTIVKVTLRRLK